MFPAVDGARRDFLLAAACAPLAGCANLKSAPPAQAGFEPITPGIADALKLPADYAATTVARWGDAVGLAGALPAWRPDAGNSAEEQALQVGQQIGALQYLPLQGSARGLLLLGHDRSDEGALHPDGVPPWTPEKVRKSQAAIGLSVLEVALGDGGWQRVQPAAAARRITASTPLALSGPAAGHALLKTAADPSGRRVLGCGGINALALTPWGTCLAGEGLLTEAFATADQPTGPERRYGLRNDPLLRWFEHEPRFDAVRHPNEPHRFGWVLEFDPLDPTAAPIKRTALGRRAHAALATALTPDGHAIVYLADATPFEPMARFVSHEPVRAGGAAANATLLDRGQLQLARFDPDGSGRWLPVLADSSAAGAAETLVRLRPAADRLRATALDGATALALDGAGWVHAALVGTALRGVPGQPPIDAANPRAFNSAGHLLRWRETRDPSHFEWALGPRGGTDYAVPASLASDPRGLVWLGSAIPAAGVRRGEFAALGHNALLALDPVRGGPRRFLAGPVNAAISGASFTPDARTLFVAVRNPGLAPGGISDPLAPRRHSNWPDFSPIGRPRSAVVAVRRLDGGVVGA